MEEDPTHKRLIVACQNGDEAELDKILNQGNVDVNKGDIWGCTPLIWVSALGYYHMARKLLEQEGIDSNVKSNQGCTALMYACSHGQRYIVELLVNKNGIDFNAVDEDGRTALSIARAKGHHAIIKMLEQKQREVQKPNSMLRSPSAERAKALSKH